MLKCRYPTAFKMAWRINISIKNIVQRERLSILLLRVCKASDFFFI